MEGEPLQEAEARLEGDLLTFSLGGRLFRLFLGSPRPGGVAGASREEVVFEGDRFELEVAPEGALPPTAERRGSAQPVRVTTPMPGRVISVRVASGDKVARGDLLVTLEAMKMQNEFCAPTAGVVTEVRATPGAVAVAGEVLLVITPEGL